MKNEWLTRYASRIAVLALLWLLGAGCTPVADLSSLPGQAKPGALVVASHDSFSASEEVLADFSAETGIELQFLALGDAGEALNKMILSKDAPLADIFFGVDNTFLSRALAAEIFLPYASPLLAQIPDVYELDPEQRLLPVDYGFVNLNADRGWFAEKGLPIPATLEELAQPAYKGLLVVENPASSSPGLAFLLATIAYFGEEGYLDYWRALRANDVLVTDGWSEAYFEHFTVGGGGDRPLVVSYSSSPPADVLFAGDGRTEPASVNVNPPGGTFRQIEFVGIVAGTKQEAAARRFVDFLLDRAFQEDIPLQMFVYPVNSRAALPDLFVQFGETPDDPAVVDPAAIEANREGWIAAWTDVMVR
ncbi:MAG: thiamine ABC transporter substrate-binding protein [Caldilineaceae bacterium]|nr:thiamine ABC transporter substrate-binding protein [Caldilineaceae bacterium]